jgi:hypothetical protein
MQDENHNLLKKIRFLFSGCRHKWMFDKKSLFSSLKVLDLLILENVSLVTLTKKYLLK